MEDFDALRAAVAVGDGVVLRLPGVLCLAAADDPAELRMLLDIVRAAAGPQPGRALARRLAGWLGGPEAPTDGLRFVTVAATGDRVAVFLLGGAGLRIPEQDIAFSGAESAAWIDRLMSYPGVPVLLDVGGIVSAAELLAGPSDLRAGVVPGAAVALSPAVLPRGAAAMPDVGTIATGDPATGPHAFGDRAIADSVIGDPATVGPQELLPAAVPPPAAEEVVPPPPRRVESILGVAPADARPPLDAGGPAAMPGKGASPVGDEHDDPQARGHLCSRGHLNDPRSHFCVLCGIRMNEKTGVLVIGSRPPLGLLVFDDGVTYTVDAEYLVGRRPDSDDRVRSGALRSILVEDRSGAVSRVHAEIRLDGWNVVLVDSGSRNGTYVAGPGEPGWSALPARNSHRLVPGTRVRLGSRTFVFESPSGVR